MTTLILEGQVASPVHSSVTLEGVESGVIHARRRLLRHLESLPKPFDSLAVKYYRERLHRAGHRPMLGEYAPFLLGQVFGASQGTVEAVCLPWFTTYAHALALDDVLDRITDSSPARLVLGEVLLDSALTLWKPHFDNHDGLWEVFVRCRSESATAMLGEFATDRESGSTSARVDDEAADAEHLLIGKKAALIKLLASSLSLETRDRLLSPPEDAGVENMCAGIQLLDERAADNVNGDAAELESRRAVRILFLG